MRYRIGNFKNTGSGNISNGQIGISSAGAAMSVAARPNIRGKRIVAIILRFADEPEYEFRG